MKAIDIIEQATDIVVATSQEFKLFVEGLIDQIPDDRSADERQAIIKKLKRASLNHDCYVADVIKSFDSLKELLAEPNKKFAADDPLYLIVEKNIKGFTKIFNRTMSNRTSFMKTLATSKP